MQEIQKEQRWGQRDKGKELKLKDTLYWEKYEEIQEKYFQRYLAKKSSIRKQGNYVEHASGRNAGRGV